VRTTSAHSLQRGRCEKRVFPQPKRKRPGKNNEKARFPCKCAHRALGSPLALGTRMARAMGTKGQMAVQL